MKQSTPDEKPEAPKGEPKKADAGPATKTPAEWALECGHVNARPKGLVRPGAKTMRSWIYDATKVHAGWGSRVAADVRLTREQYEAAVNAACNVSLG